MVSHFYILQGNAEFVTLRSSGNSVDIGTISVGGFFAISGYLLTKSATSQTTGMYMIKRIFRIFPAYWLHLIIVTMGLFILDFSIPNSISSDYEIPKAKYITHILNNFALWQSNKEINGLFPNNLYPHLVNASLWSLFPEFICYILLILSIKICTRFEVYPHLALFVIIGASIVFGLGILFVEDFMLFSNNFFDEKRIEALIVMNALQSFAVGSLLAAYPKILLTLRNKKLSIVILSGIFILANLFSAYFLLGSICFSIIVVLIGSGNQLLKIFRWCDEFDLSFGVFLYHAPILQVLISLSLFGIISISSLHMLLLLILATFSLAMFSWILVEKPSKGLARRISRNFTGI
jgi:peptidoglycan/LPS O-acetylase OafA/YrhL